MNPFPMYHHLHAKPMIGGYGCGKCKLFRGDESAAEACCKLATCACGAECETGWVTCTPCRQRHEQEAEARCFERAKKLTPAEYDGYVYSDREGVFHPWLEDYLETCEDDGTQSEAYVYACTPFALKMDVGDILESVLEEHYEDAGKHIPPALKQELQAYLTAWCARTGIVSQQIDRSRVIVIGEVARGEDD